MIQQQFQQHYIFSWDQGQVLLHAPSHFHHWAHPSTQIDAERKVQNPLQEGTFCLGGHYSLHLITLFSKAHAKAANEFGILFGCR